MNGANHTIIGIPRQRVDGRAKVTGQTRFADDVVLPRMLYCKLLRSPIPMPGSSASIPRARVPVQASNSSSPERTSRSNMEFYR